MLPEAQASQRGVLPSMLRASTSWGGRNGVRVGGSPHGRVLLTHVHLCKDPHWHSFSGVSQGAVAGKGIQDKGSQAGSAS